LIAKYLFLIMLSCNVLLVYDFLRKNKTMRVFVIFGLKVSVNTYKYYFKNQGKWEYFLVLNVGTKNSKHVAVLTVGPWSCGTSAARPGREYRHFCEILSRISH
jgi:hypothetical protein